MEAYIEHSVPCPPAASMTSTKIRKFNMMFKLHQGVITEDNAAEIFPCARRPPRAFRQLQERGAPPGAAAYSGICQIGKSFRK